MSSYPPPPMHHLPSFRRSPNTSTPQSKLPYALATPAHPPTPSSSFDPAPSGMQFASPDGYSQPPTPSSVLDPGHHAMSQQATVSSHGFAVNPMDRFMQSETPYSTVHLSAQSMPQNRSYPPMSSFTAMQPSIRSDSISLNAPLYPTAHSDIGYFPGHHRAYSTASHDPSSFNHEIPEGIRPLDSLKVSPRAQGANKARGKRQSQSQSSLPAIHQDNVSASGREDLTCPHCHIKPRLKSELKKHILRHLRPFKCDIADCARAKKGFTTPNDLDRHKRSKHKVFPDSAKVYVCAAPACQDHGKAWPRFDNFKQHVERMHKMEDMNDLLQRSEQSARDVNAGNIMAASTMHDLKGINASRDGLTSVHDEYPTFEEISMFSEDPLRPAPISHSDAHSTADSLADFEAAVYPTSSYYDAAAATAVAPPFDQQQWPTEEGGYGYDASTRGPAIIVHNAPAQRQRQDQDLAHMSAGTRTDPATAFDPDFKLPSPPSRTRNVKQQQVRARARPAKVYKANSTGSRAVTVVNSANGPKTRVQRSAVTPGAQCAECLKILPRQCDLKKHARRHTRPFGCTFSGCGKAFGSKNDWKRHEASQHFTEEAWRCPLACSLFPDEAALVAHFTSSHPETTLSDKERAATKIGRNHQCTFWCGFCREVQTLQRVGRRAWDERFDHIGSHFLSENRSVRDWLVPDGQLTKGELGEAAIVVVGGNKARKEESDALGEADVDPEVGPGVGPGVQSGVEAEEQDEDEEDSGSGSDQCFCCSCNDGPYAATTPSCACQACGHRCADCFDGARVARR